MLVENKKNVRNYGSPCLLQLRNVPILGSLQSGIWFNLVRWPRWITAARIYVITPPVLEYSSNCIFGIMISVWPQYLAVKSYFPTLSGARAVRSGLSDWSIMGNDIHCCVMDLISSYDQPWDLLWPLDEMDYIYRLHSRQALTVCLATVLTTYSAPIEQQGQNVL